MIVRIVVSGVTEGIKNIFPVSAAEIVLLASDNVTHWFV